jgi:hypothetical protein
MLNMNRRLWSDFKNLLAYGDLFWEIIINQDNPTEGIYKISRLPADSMYRIETTKGNCVEFQQSKEGPDYTSLLSSPVLDADDAKLMSSTAIRFAPEQIVHLRIGEDRKSFYPYGVSVIEPARGPAQQLRLCEDAMLVYRLSRSTERRIFYIDVGTLPPFKAEAFIERMKAQFRKRKATTRNLSGVGVSAIDERWHAPAIDEDFWLPTRPNSQTKIETLPGATNLGEVSDVNYFKEKLFISLNFPLNYFQTQDFAVTKTTLSSQDSRFARLIERFQSAVEDSIWELADRHLRLKGYPKESYSDLMIKLTPPSDWRELSRAEVVTARITNATTIKSSLLLSDFDIITKYLRFSKEDAQEMLARLKIQKLEDAKLQILGQNPQLLGIGVPSNEEEKGLPEIGTTPEGPNTELSPEGEEKLPTPESEESGSEEKLPSSTKSSGTSLLPEPSQEDLEKFDMGLEDYAAEQDNEEIDYSEEEEF